MWGKRLLEVAAMIAIGDSLLCILSPRRHTSLWLDGPPVWRRACEPFVKHPDMTRMLGLFGLGFGLWLAWRQEPEVETNDEHRLISGEWAGRLKELAR
jgi:hypothetical protein